MDSGKFTADDTTKEIKPKCGVISVSVKGTFGGGTVALEKETNGVFYPAMDRDTGLAITSTSDDDYTLDMGSDDVIRLVLTGSTSPDIDWQTSDYNR